MKRTAFATISIAVAVIVGFHIPSVNGSPGIDSTDALQAQFDALQPGGYLKLESRVYEHGGVLRLNVPDVRIDGNGATLRATNDQYSAVQVAADGVQLTNLHLSAPTEGKRWSGPDQHKLVLSANGIRLSHISIEGSAAAGIFIDDAHTFRVDDVSITGSRADGIHMTGGSRGGVITNVRTDQTGDDGVSIVSYSDDGQVTGDIQLTDVTVASTRWGRGISVVGGQDVSIRGFSVANTSAAGIYIASEGDPYYTDSVDSVDVSGGTVTGANRDTGVVQGAVLVYCGNGGQHVRDVRISAVNVAATPASAQRVVGAVVDGGSLDRISFDGINITGSATQPFYSNTSAGAYRISNWTVDGSPVTDG